MNPELQNAIAELVSTITEGAKGAGIALQNIAPEAWRIAIRQIQIEAISNIVLFGFIGVVIIIAAQFTTLVGLRSAKRVAKMKEDELNSLDSLAYKYNDKVMALKASNEEVIGWRIGYLAMNFVGSIFIVGALTSQATDLLNPQYKVGVYAIQLASQVRITSCEK
jgi:hypothetical protein